MNYLIGTLLLMSMIIQGCSPNTSPSKTFQENATESALGIVSIPAAVEVTTTGSTPTITLTIKTTGSAAQNIALSLDSAAVTSGFSLLTSSCANVSKSRPCTARIKFNPDNKVNGDYLGVLLAGDLDIPLKGIVDKPAPVSAMKVFLGGLEITELDFGSAALNSASITKVLVVKDESGKQKTTAAITVSSADFKSQTSSCTSVSINSTSGCSVRVIFSPSGKAAGEYTANLNIGELVLPLTAIIQTPVIVNPILKLYEDLTTLAPAVHDFGTINGNNKVSLVLTLKNEGLTSYIGLVPVLSGSTAFTITSSNCTSVLGAGGKCQFQLNANAANKSGVQETVLSLGGLTMGATFVAVQSSLVCGADEHIAGGVCVPNVYLAQFTDPVNPNLAVCGGTVYLDKTMTSCIRQDNGANAALLKCVGQTPGPAIKFESQAGQIQVPVDHGTKTMSCAAGETQEQFVSLVCTDSGYRVDGEICVAEQVRYEAEFSSWGSCSAQVCTGISGIQERQLTVCKKFVDEVFTENSSLDNCESQNTSANLELSCVDEGGELNLEIDHGDKVVSCLPGSNAQNIVSLTCDSSYHREGDECRDDVRSCTPMPTNALIATEIWQAGNQMYSACNIEECQPESYLENNECISQSCVPNEESSCLVDNGQGSQVCNAQGSAYGQCVASSCSEGYNLVDNACMPNLVALTMTVSGVSGGIAATPASYTGLPGCRSGTCVGNFAENAVLTLTATPDYGSTFSGWSGGSCSGTVTTCTVTMSSAKTVTATFATSTSNLTKGIAGTAIPRFVKIVENGKILLGASGPSMYYDNLNRGRLIRTYSDGTIDLTFSTYTGTFSGGGAIAGVAMASDNTYLVFGGFTGGLVKLNLDGTIDTTFNGGVAGFNGSVEDLKVLPDGSMLAVGGFTTYNGVTYPSYMLKLTSSGTVDTSFTIPGSGFDNSLRKIGIQSDGKYIVSGNFHNFNGEAVPKFLLRLNTNGTLDNSFNFSGNTVSPTVIKVLADDSILYGPSSCTPPGCLLKYTPDGLLDTTFSAPTVPGQVSTIYEYADGKIMVSGNSIRRMNADGSSDTTFNIGTGPAITQSLSSFTVNPDKTIVLCGWFVSFNGNTGARRFTKINNDGSNYANFRQGSSGTIRSSQSGNDNHVVITDTATTTSKYYIGGEFGAYTGVRRPGVVRINLNGSLDTSFPMTNAPTVNEVNALALDSSGRLYVGGTFSDRGGFYRVTAAGVLDTSYGVASFLSILDFYPKSIAVNSSGLAYMGGSTSSSDLQTGKRIARLNAAGTAIDTTFAVGTGLNGQVTKMALDTTGNLFVIGAFTTYNGASSPRIVKILTSNGSRDTSFVVGTGFTQNSGGQSISINAMLVHSTGIYVGGAFTHYNGVASANFVKLSTGGVRDSTFSVTAIGNYSINALAIDSSNRLYAANGTAPRLIRVSSTGVKDNAFNTAMGSGFNDAIHSIAIDSTGKILVSGAFTLFNGTVVDGFIKLNADGTISQ